MRKLFIKYKEQIFYVLFGAATTLIDYCIYTLSVLLLASAFSNEIACDSLCNIIAWAAAVVFAFFSNKLWVFNSRSFQKKIVIKEAAAFFASRIFTGLIEIALLPLLMSIGLDMPLLNISGGLAKIIITVIVVILNYFFSKFIIFRKKNKNAEDR